MYLKGTQNLFARKWSFSLALKNTKNKAPHNKPNESLHSNHFRALFAYENKENCRLQHKTGIRQRTNDNAWQIRENGVVDASAHLCFQFCNIKPENFCVYVYVYLCNLHCVD